MNYTPGPWTIGDSDLPVSQFAVLQSEPTRKHSTILRMAKGIQPFEEISANAHLIAAAPDLLEAAIALKDVCNRPSCARTRAEAWRNLDKAIAKATGAAA